ncbi:copper homeostasis protein CutC [Pedobacter arcticus]|uniref:copper homeostasis protein CutC n=1 Tax=Pedobacter arcticus TaxID=752140 RepID=UPI0002DAF6A8|nr:copper homeostasis protein CutC [Pedobacter arcticus]
MNTPLIEIATSDFATTKAAVKGGADRIELCANLYEGGTTASYGTIKKCRESFEIPIFPIIRPRGGDFLFKEEEFEIMQSDIKLCKDLACDGVVIGMLNTDGQIDLAKVAQLIALAYPMQVTFHRAFDCCLDPFKAMEQLIELGCQRILTSGQYPTAPEGVQLISQLQQAAKGRIIIMPGSGIRRSNIQSLFKMTGCSEFHASLREREGSKMNFIHPNFTNVTDTYVNNTIHSEDVRMLKMAVQIAANANVKDY